MRRRVFISCLFIALAGLCTAANTSWTRLAINGPGNWNDVANWSAGVPNATSNVSYTGSSAGLAEIQVTDAQTYGEKIYHGTTSAGAAPLLRIMNGGSLEANPVAEDNDHIIIGLSSGNIGGNILIEAGGLLKPRAKLYCAYGTGVTGTVDVAGTLDFTSVTHGLLVLGNTDTSMGTCNVLDGGIVKVFTFIDTYRGIDQPIKDGGLLNIEGTGKVVCVGNVLSDAEAFIARESDHIAGNGVLGNVIASYDAGLDETTITAEPLGDISPLGVTVEADKGYTRGLGLLIVEATVVDDGIPAPAVLTWSQTAGPGTATFASPNSAMTFVDFDAGGVYTLRLTADNRAGGGSEIVYDELVVTANNPTCQDLKDHNMWLAGDVNGDCYVNLADVAEIAAAWLNCNDPQETGCGWAWE